MLEWARRIVAVGVVALAGCGGGKGGGNDDTTGGSNAAPTQVALVEISSSAKGVLSASWLPAADDHTATSALRYQVHASTAGSSFTPDASTQVFEGVGVTSASISAGLSPGQTYAVKLVVLDAAGAATASSALSATVADTDATPVAGVAVQTLTAAQVSAQTDTTLTLASGTAAPAIGSFIGMADAASEQGYLRKVTGVSLSGGVTTVQTEPASLNQVFKDIQISSTVKFDTVTASAARLAGAAGVAQALAAPLDAAGHTPYRFHWPQTGFSYRVGVPTAVATAAPRAVRQASARTRGAVDAQALPVGEFFESSNAVRVDGNYGRVEGHQRIYISEGAAGTSPLTLSIINRAIPRGSSTAVGVCKVEIGAVRYQGEDGHPAGVSVTRGDWTVVQSMPVDGRIKVANQDLRFAAAVGAAATRPYKVTVTAYFDDVGDGCSGDQTFSLWRETQEFEFEIYVTGGNLPAHESKAAVWSGGATGPTISGTVETTFAPELTFESTLSDGRLTHALIKVQASPRLDETLSLSLHADAAGDLDQTVAVIEPRKFFKVYPGPGGVPIVLAGVFRLDLRIKGHFTGALDAQQAMTVGFDEVSYGLEYANGTFQPLQSMQPVYRLRVGGQGKAQAHLEMHPLPSLELTTYEMATAKAVLNPYLLVDAGVEGHVQMDADIDFDTLQTNLAADADFRLTQARLGGGVWAWMYADLHVWDHTLLAYPADANKNDYTTFKQLTLLADTTLTDLPALSATVLTDGRKLATDPLAVPIQATATNVPNPLASLFSGQPASYTPWQRWTAPRVIPPLGTPNGSYTVVADPNGSPGLHWLSANYPGTYTVRLGGYSNWGNWARQYTEVQVPVGGLTLDITAYDDVGSQTGPLGLGASTDDPTPTLSGTLAAALPTGASVRVYDGSTLLGKAIVNGTAWIYPPPTLAVGDHLFTLVLVSAEWVEGARSASWGLTITEPVPIPTGKLPDTGITAAQCVQADSNILVSCTSAAAIALNAKQDGMVGRDVTAPDNTDGKLGFSYTKIAADGATLPASATTWACVKDQLTGLMWEVKTADGGLRDYGNTYTNWGNGQAGDASAFVAAVNAAGLCGKTDWRLPTVNELQGLVDYGVDDNSGRPTIDETFFPNTARHVYWTSSPMVDVSGTAWFVYFYYGYVYWKGCGSDNYVRLVRQGV